MRRRDFQNHSMYPIASLFEPWINSFFNDNCDKRGIVYGSRAIPIDLVEKDDKYSLYLNLPGINKQDVKISQHKDVLSIKVSKAGGNESEGKTYHYKEIYKGEMQREIKLPADCDKENIKASMDNGVLKFTIPKIEPEPHKEIVLE